MLNSGSGCFGRCWCYGCGVFMFNSGGGQHLGVCIVEINIALGISRKETTVFPDFKHGKRLSCRGRDNSGPLEHQLDTTGLIVWGIECVGAVE